MKSEEELELEEIADQAQVVGKLTPREYARLRRIAPQLVYYYIRNGAIDTERCQCGRKIIDVARTDKAISERRKKQGRSPLVSGVQTSSEVLQTVREQEG